MSPRLRWRLLRRALALLARQVGGGSEAVASTRHANLALVDAKHISRSGEPFRLTRIATDVGGIAHGNSSTIPVRTFRRLLVYIVSRHGCRPGGWRGVEGVRS